MTKGYHKKMPLEQGAAREKDWTLPATFVLQVQDLLTVMKEGLLAVGAMAALHIAEQIMEAEVEEKCGPKGRHRPDRTATRYGRQPGYVVLGGRKAKVSRPRVRTKDGREVELESYRELQDRKILSQAALERMLYGLASRHYQAGGEPIGAGIKTYSTSKSTVSRRFVKATEEELKSFLRRPLGDLKLLVVFIDAIFLGGHAVLIALGVDGGGQKHVLGLWEGAAENAEACSALLKDLVGRGMDAREGLLFVMDGSKALTKAVRETFGELALVQRCQKHKMENVVKHLPEREQQWLKGRLKRAWAVNDAQKAKAELEVLIKELEMKSPGAAASLREGLEETLTVQKLGLPALLRRSLRTTNAIESLNGQIRDTVRRVRNTRNGDQALRWATIGAQKAEGRFHKIPGYRDLPILAEAIAAYVQRVKETQGIQAATRSQAV
ncbi:IS256 family transposase [Thermogutta sp.]|uniref:IS256 family transposase n=1 Tax=Thermogutta sp. TaxID=1962930 RepID=UPI00321FE946